MKIDPVGMTRAAGEASALLKAMSHPSRLITLCLLAERERSVGELAMLLGARDSTISQHLALLRRDGLVRARRDGQTIWYAIDSAPAQRLLETLAAIFCAVPTAPAPEPPAPPMRRTSP